MSMEEELRFSPESYSEEDISSFRILIATDTHVGYKEKDHVRGDDSFDTLEEILMIAKALEVDFLIHGGDFFDEHKPSRNTMYKTLRLLREYCLGDGPINFNVVDSEKRFKFGINFRSPDVNVNLPVFAIHGNHDDPGEESKLSPLDILEASNFINYFGRADDLENIEVAPILFEKGTSKLALYGLGWIRDERLHRIFQGDKVKFTPPQERENWFNLMVIHQSRYKGLAGGIPRKDFIHDGMLPSFLDLVIWGHEHDCVIGPTQSLKGGYDIIQLGSSIQTSLSPGEALPKHIALLEITGNNFTVTAIPLLTVRPFYYKEIALKNFIPQPSSDDDIRRILTEHVDEILEENDKTNKKHKPPLLLSAYNCVRAPPNLPDVHARLSKVAMCARMQEMIEKKSLLPLMRLKVENSGFSTINIPRFGSNFMNRVGNPGDFLSFFKRRAPNEKNSKGLSAGGLPVIALEDASNGDADTAEVHDLVFHYMEDSSTLDLFPEPDLNFAVQEFVVQLNPHAINNFVKKSIDEAQKDAQKELQSSQKNYLSGKPSTESVLEYLRKRTQALRVSRMNEDGFSNTKDTQLSPLVQADLLPKPKAKPQAKRMTGNLKRPVDTFLIKEEDIPSDDDLQDENSEIENDEFQEKSARYLTKSRSQTVLPQKLHTCAASASTASTHDTAGGRINSWERKITGASLTSKSGREPKNVSSLKKARGNKFLASNSTSGGNAIFDEEVLDLIDSNENLINETSTRQGSKYTLQLSAPKNPPSLLAKYAAINSKTASAHSKIGDKKITNSIEENTSCQSGIGSILKASKSWSSRSKKLLAPDNWSDDED